MPLISIVIPCFNEQDSLSVLFSGIDAAISSIDGCEFEIICVNDGSTDETLTRLEALVQQRADLVVLDLSRNFDKEAALSAGINAAQGDAIIPFDADLQDPPELIAELISQWKMGFEVVLARRDDRELDSAAKRLSSRWFYRIHNRMSEVPLPEDVGDFRLMDRVVVDALKALPENRRFMKARLRG